MKVFSNTRAIVASLLFLFVVTILVGCSCPVQKIRLNTSPDRNEEAILNLSINKNGEFIFTDKDGNPDPNTISFDEFVTHNANMPETGQTEQANDEASYKKRGFKKIQSIDVYRRKGSVDIAFCIDNVCSCRRYNNQGHYCCACNCPCPN